jgi:hypothetical protein
MQSEMQYFLRPSLRLFLLFLSGFTMLLFQSAARADFPGGFVEQPSTAVARPPLSLSQIQAFLPSRGKFTFPAPYNTEGVRITNASDCGGADCVQYIGYSYWRNMNNSAGSNIMYIFVGLNRAKGGTGPTLFSYNKTTDEVKNLGPLFDSASGLGSSSGEGWYFSAVQPTKLYLNDGPRMVRYDVLTHQSQVVFDVSKQFGSGYNIWQMHSSDDDTVHSATLRNSAGNYLGCLAYHEDTGRYQYFPQINGFDECSIDRSGRWLMSLENVDNAHGVDMRVFDLSSGANLLTPGVNPITAGGLSSSAQLMSAGIERRVMDQDGAVGHFGMGFGYVTGADDWGNQGNTQLLWDFTKNPLSGSLVLYTNQRIAAAPDHISNLGPQAGVPLNQQFACGSSASASTGPWANEVICYKLDGSLKALVVAPVMTNMNSSVGGGSYNNSPKGNVDITGQYFIWTSNTGGTRRDVFLAKVPIQKLGITLPGAGGGGTTPPVDTVGPTVNITSPAGGTTVTGTVAIRADASDNVGVAGVQFQLDGARLGAEDTTAPYSVNWNTATSAAGTHTLTAVARDAAGNSTTSDPVTATIDSGDFTVPVISSLAVANVSTTGATISWNTNEASDSQVEYGTSTSYGHTTTLDDAPVIQHSVSLTGLSSSTLYHYRVLSRDAGGNVAKSADATFTTAAVVSGSGAQDVAWTGAVNATATGNSLQKSGGCDGCDDAGAVSQQQIASGDGYLEFTVSETNLVRFLGLNNGSGVTDMTQMPFAFKIVSGTAEVREKGVYRWARPVVTGDVLRIAIQGGTVTYSKNGEVFYTSTATPVYPLRADAVLWSKAATLTKVMISGVAIDTGTPPGTGGDTGTGGDSGSGSNDTGGSTGGGVADSLQVSWQGSNVTLSGDTLKKTGGCDGCQDAGAVSLQQIKSGDGYLQFTVTDPTLVRYVGLTNLNKVTLPAQLPFAFKLVSGYAEAREGGTYRSDTPVVVGDVLRIAIQSGTVTYLKNGKVFYTSKLKPSYPLRAGTAMSSMGATVKAAVLSGSAVSVVAVETGQPGETPPGSGGGSVNPWTLGAAGLAAWWRRHRGGRGEIITTR